MMEKRGGGQSTAMGLSHTSEFVAIEHLTVNHVANWLIVIGCQCDATQDAEDINNKDVLARCLPRKHLPCYAIIIIV